MKSALAEILAPYPIDLEGSLHAYVTHNAGAEGSSPSLSTNTFSTFHPSRRFSAQFPREIRVSLQCGLRPPTNSRPSRHCSASSAPLVTKKVLTILERHAHLALSGASHPARQERGSRVVLRLPLCNALPQVWLYSFMNSASVRKPDSFRPLKQVGCMHLLDHCHREKIRVQFFKFLDDPICLIELDELVGLIEVAVRNKAHSRGWVSSSCAKRFTPLHPSVDDEVVILERTAGDGP